MVHLVSRIPVDLSVSEVCLLHESAVRHGTVFLFGDTLFCVATAEDLLFMSLIAWRERDVRDCEELLIANPEIDRESVTGWVKAYEGLIDEPDFSPPI